jgi:hypothetical protein
MKFPLISEYAIEFSLDGQVEVGEIVELALHIFNELLRHVVRLHLLELRSNDLLHISAGRGKKFDKIETKKFN